MMTSLSTHMLRVVGLVRPGVSHAEAIADLSLISRRVHDANRSDPFIFLGANNRPLLDHIVGNVKEPLYILLAATVCVPLIACCSWRVPRQGAGISRFTPRSAADGAA